MAISTNGVILTRLAGALYNQQLSNATYNEVLTAFNSPTALNTLANYLISTDFASRTDLQISTTLITNLGLTAVTGLDNWIAAQLTAAGANKGAKIISLLNDFSNMSMTDATYGAAVTAFNTKVDAAQVLSQTSGNTGSAFSVAGTQGTTFSLTASTDALTGTSGADTFSGSFNGGGANNVAFTLSLGDKIDGAGGIDSLVLNDAGVTNNPTLTLPTGAALTSVETVTINGATNLTVDATPAGWASVSTLNVNGVGATVATASSTAALNVVTTSATNAGTTSADGGSGVTVKVTGAALTTGQTGSAVTLGGTTAVAGAVDVNVANTTSASANTNTAAGGAIAISGGSTVSVTQSIAQSAAAAAALKTAGGTVTLTQGNTTVVGTAATNAVTISQTAAAAAVTTAGSATAAVVAGDTTVNDVNRASATVAGTIKTVSLTNSGAAVVNSGALTTLNLAGTLTTVNAGTLGALTTPANTALTVNLTGATSTGALTIDTDITTINIASSGAANTLADLVDASATAVNISGTSALTITANTLNAAAVITSTNTGATTLTQALGVNQQYVGGEGVDNISVGATTKAINTGGGNDVVTISTETLGTGGTINGGAGTNTIVANTNASTLSANSNFTNFTTLRVAGAAAQGAHNAGGFTALEVGALAGAQSFTNVPAGTPLTYLAAPGQTTAYTLANATGTSDVLNVTISSAAAVDAGTLTAAGIETVNITTTDTNTTTQQDTLNLVASSATRITVTGNAGLAFTNDTGNTKVTVFDASGVSGASTAAANMAVTYTSRTTVANSATTTITGGSGNDTLTGGATADTINGGLGNDVIDGGTGADVIDGGAGTNTFVAVANGTASVEGAGTGSVEGVAVNLGSTAIVAATINAAMGGTIGLSGASATLAAGTSQYTFATQSNLFAATADTLTNIQNVTATAGADYIVGSTANNVINGLAGIDQILLGTATAGGSDTVRIASATATNRDIVSGFTAGAVTSTGQADVININTALGTLTGTDNFASAASIQTSGAAGNKIAAAATEVIYVSAAAIADATSANSLDGTNVLAAMGGTLTGAIVGTNTLLLVVGITGGGTAVYYATSADNAIIAGEISLVGVLNGVAVADLVFSNFTNVA